jgi:hypothetical protein
MTFFESFEFQIEIFAQNATEEDIDLMTRQLLAEVRQMDVESVSLIENGKAPSGTKSADPITIGALAVVVLPTLLPKVVEAVQAWALRGQGKTVKFKGRIGRQTIEFEGSAEELEKLLNKLAKGRKNK